VSQENVEIVKRSLDAYNAGDIDTMLSFYSTEIEARPDASVFPEAGPVHGLEEWRAWLEEVGSAWVTAQYGISELFAVDDGRVVHRGKWDGEGATSGIALDSSITGIYTIRDDQISRVEFFFDHANALQAVGLEA
jgi:ketosteroid isomerase-like protein